MKRIIVSFLLLSVFSTHGFSQLEEPSKPKSAKEYFEPSGHALGVILSSVNGKGLAYRYWKNRAGIHTSFIPLSNKERTLYNVGLTGYYSIRKYDIGSLFLHVGCEYQYMTEDMVYYPASIDPPTEYRETTTGYHFGFGPGLHVLQKFISMDLFIGYGFYAKEMKTSFEGIKPEQTFNSTLSGGIALFIEL